MQCLADWCCELAELKYMGYCYRHRKYSKPVNVGVVNKYRNVLHQMDPPVQSHEKIIDLCPICRDDMYPSQSVLTKCCQKPFHRKCLRHWSVSCPLCRHQPLQCENCITSPLTKPTFRETAQRIAAICSEINKHVKY